MVQHFHVTYNDIHNLIRRATPRIAKEFTPDLLVAIGICSFHFKFSYCHLIDLRWRVRL